MTLTTQLVLRALLADPGREMYGREIMQAASLATGTVYPILARLEAEGWISVRDEEIDKHAEGRPKRRYYQLTTKGAEEAGTAMSRASTQLARLGLDGPAQTGPLGIGGIGIGVTADERQPPGTVTAISAGRDERGGPAVSVAHMVNVAANCPHPKARINKGLCGNCGTYVGK